MVKIDGEKIGEIKQHYEEQSKREIAKAINDPETDLKEDDIDAIINKWKYQANNAISKMMQMSPEKLFKQGFALNSNGWREGYTKPLIKDRVEKRRAKKKQSKISKRINKKK